MLNCYWKYKMNPCLSVDVCLHAICIKTFINSELDKPSLLNFPILLVYVAFLSNKGIRLTLVCMGFIGGAWSSFLLWEGACPPTCCSDFPLGGLAFSRGFCIFSLVPLVNSFLCFHAFFSLPSGLRHAALQAPPGCDGFCNELPVEFSSGLVM